MRKTTTADKFQIVSSRGEVLFRIPGVKPPDPPIKETPLLKINKAPGGKERQLRTLWIAVYLANGEMRPVKIQWGAGKNPFPLAATIYNNADIMARTKTH